MSPQANPKKRRPLGMRILVRYGIIAVAAGMLLTSVIYASQRFEQFLIRDPRFLLPGPPDYGMESPNLQVTGVKYASRWQILRVFEPDFGRSLYLFPLKARRKALLGMPWVHNASIVRIWPNRVLVRVEERQPAAFVKLQAESMERWALIDEEGVILDPPHKATFHLPLLSGVRDESAARRGARVRRGLRMLEDLGGLADDVSEVDVSDLDDLKITEKVARGAVTLMLGDRNFSLRLRNFLAHYSDIRLRIPQVRTFDLRLDDRITGVAN